MQMYADLMRPHRQRLPKLTWLKTASQVSVWGYLQQAIASMTQGHPVEVRTAQRTSVEKERMQREQYALVQGVGGAHDLVGQGRHLGRVREEVEGVMEMKTQVGCAAAEEAPWGGLAVQGYQALSQYFA